MPFSEDLLNPIPGDNPSGHNLRHAPVYDKIKEARREEDETPQGDWVHERKRADYAVVLRLCSDALVNQTKDLQLAVWMTEALLKLEGLAGLYKGLDFLRRLLHKFWETLYPELEDGDAEFRAASLDWLGSKFSEQLRLVPLTRSGLDWLRYKESRVVGYEADAANNETKRQVRERAINEGKITAEQFDEALSKTPKTFYETSLTEVNACLTALDALNETCEALFGEFRPGFSGLQEDLEDLRQNIHVFVQKKQDQNPTPAQELQPAVTAENIPEKAPGAETQRTRQGEAAAALVNPTREPKSVEDAVDYIILAAHYLRREQPQSPVPYLLLRALRWGELRASHDGLDLSLLEAPSTEVRKQLRALAQNGDWQELLHANETAMASSCGRGWLDLQRYAVKASAALGDPYAGVSSAIISHLKALVGDYPELVQSALTDETPAANRETQAWIAELLARKEEISPPSYPMESQVDAATADPGVVDAYELAKAAACSGRSQEAIEILEREAAQERSGRGRFQRKMQLAQICIGAGYTSIALPILDALAGEIDERNLEDWEDADVVIHALGLLYQCLDKLKRSPEQKERVYARICRLGPAQALELAK